MIFFNGTAFPESAKSAENEFYHLLACDNGTFTVSDKRSGAVYFEFPTLLVGENDSYCYCTHSQIMKSRASDAALFTTADEIPLSIAPTNGDFLKNHIFFKQISLTDSSDILSLTVSFAPCKKEVILRLPTGATEPQVQAIGFMGELETEFLTKENIFITNEMGSTISISLPCEMKASITQDGNIDLVLNEINPIIAPENHQMLSFTFDITLS